VQEPTIADAPNGAAALNINTLKVRASVTICERRVNVDLETEILAGILLNLHSHP
jgi:hypothetical protein